MTWRVKFVRSKDAQKQLARTSLSIQFSVDEVLHIFQLNLHSFCFVFFFRFKLRELKRIAFVHRNRA